MGTYSIIDDDPNKAPRCLNIKLAVVLINLIGPSVSLIFLIYCIIKMMTKKEKIKILTTIILLVFFAETVHCISKLLQILKYAFEDRRVENEYKMNGRAIICQFQIVMSIYTDYCSLVCTFLLSFKCYDALKYKNKYFSNNNRTKKKLIIYIELSCILAGLLFLLLDRILSEGNVNYKYDSRDRCSYWCWLGHITSEICYCFYWIILIANIVLYLKTITFLNEKQRELLEGNEKIIFDIKNTENGDFTEEKNSDQENNVSIEESNKVAKSITFSCRVKNNNMNNDDRNIINDFILIKIKCTTYSFVTNIAWLLVAIYRLFDDIMLEPFDRSDSEEDNNNDEIEYFEDHPNLAIVVQAFLVVHTFITSTRGIFYGMSFIIFEEKMFGSFFTKWFGVKKEINNDSFLAITEKKEEDFELSEGNKTIENNEEENNERRDFDDENNYKKSKGSKGDSENMEMNTNKERIIEENAEK